MVFDPAYCLSTSGADICVGEVASFSDLSAALYANSELSRPERMKFQICSVKVGSGQNFVDQFTTRYVLHPCSAQIIRTKYGLRSSL